MMILIQRETSANLFDPFRTVLSRLIDILTISRCHKNISILILSVLKYYSVDHGQCYRDSCEDAQEMEFRNLQQGPLLIQSLLMVQHSHILDAIETTFLALLQVITH